MSAEKSDLRVGDRLEPVAGERIIVGDEAERLEAGFLHALGEQHSQRLVRVPALEAVGDHEMLALVGKGLDQQLVRLGQDRALGLHLQPFANVIGKAAPVVAVAQHVPDAIGEMGRHRHALPAVGDDLPALGRSVDDDVGVLELLDLEAKAGEEEAIAGCKRRGEAFLDRAELAAVLEADASAAAARR